MKRIVGLVLLLLLAAATLAAQQTPTAPSVSGVLNRQFGNAETEFVEAADAMPENKWDWAPTQGEFKGVRTFAQQAKHLAAANYMICAAVLEEKPPVETNGESGPELLKAKADIMKFLRDSFAYCHKALDTITPESQLKQVKSPFGQGTATPMGLAVLNQGHVFDHYGQMVVYLRSNGIIPPASRPQQR